MGRDLILISRAIGIPLNGGANTFSHLGVYCADLVRSLGFREGFEGSRIMTWVALQRKLQRDQVVHIPRVLYHWRVHPTALQGVPRPSYTVQAAQRAIEEHLERLQLPLQQLSWSPLGFRAELVLPDPAPRVSVIIPTRNGLSVLEPCLTSLLRCTRYPDLEVLVVDNGSDDPGTLSFLAGLERQGQIRVLRDPSPFNYSALNNMAVEQATGQLVCLLNNDIEVLTPIGSKPWWFRR